MTHLKVLDVAIDKVGFVSNDNHPAGGVQVGLFHLIRTTLHIKWGHQLLNPKTRRNAQNFQRSRLHKHV